MLLKRFYEDRLAQASYLVACQATGQAMVVDPHRDADFYVQAAGDEGVAITHVTETHIHADYASGSRELAARTGATLLLSDEGGPEWRYGFSQESNAVLLKDGDMFPVGNIRIRVLHTPGHTPEHVSFLVTDGAATAEPMGLLSGDFIFVGDVGRPDLLEKAAGVAGATEAAARQLFQSLQRVRDLPDHLQIWPGHGAGSACGKALGAVPTSTLGYERRVSWAFMHDDEDAFVAAVLEDQPEPPRYFATMKALNRDGPTVLGHLPLPGHLGPARLGPLLGDGGLVVDIRTNEAFAGGHVAGTIHIPLNRSFTNWAGWLLPYDRAIHLLAESEEQAREAARALTLIGLDRVEGYFGPEALDDDSVREAPWVDAARARAMQDEGAYLLDVRAESEWRAGHAPGATRIHLGMLPESLDALPDDRPILVMCRTGNRSSIGQSLVLATGRRALNVAGGIEAWERRGLPITSD